MPHAVNEESALENNAALAVPVPQVPVHGLQHQPPAVAALAHNAAVPTAEMIYSQHIQQAAAANAANVLAAAPPAGIPSMSADGSDAAQLEAMHAANEAQETQTKYTGVRKNKGGRFSARIKLGGVNRCQLPSDFSSCMFVVAMYAAFHCGLTESCHAGTWGRLQQQRRQPGLSMP